MADMRKSDPLAGLLARELKGARAAGAAVCPEPDMLAAYFERSLTGAEMAGCETHFAGCARCREQLASMARMETTVAPSPHAPEAAGGLSWFLGWRWLAPVLAAGALAIWVVLRPPAPGNEVAFEARNRSVAPSSAVDAAKAQGGEITRAEAKDLNAALEPPKKDAAAAEREAALADRFKEKDALGARGAGTYAYKTSPDSGRLAHGAPAAGVQGGLAGPTDERLGRALAASGKAVEKPEAAKPAERADHSELAQLPTESREGQKVAALRPTPAAAPPVFGQESAQKKNQPAAAASTVTVEAAAETAENKRKLQAAEERAAFDKAAPAGAQQAAAKAKADTQVEQEQLTKQRAVAAAPQVAQAQSQMRQAEPAAPEAREQAGAMQRAAGPATATQRDATADAARARTATRSAQPKAEDAPRDADMKELAFRDDRGFFLAGSLARRPLWRIGPHGRIERFREQGKMWLPQSSGVTTDLLAGFAPSETVCWVVGRAGTVLLTTDAGKTWQRLGSPSDADIVAVTATDAARATITLAGGKKYSTTDAGRSWKTPE